MRITGGIYRGRRIVCPPGEIRPAMDKLRESMFAILGSLEGNSFLDLYSGSGAVAIEAASRGANPVTAVEGDSGKRRILNQNILIANGTGVVIKTHIEDVKRFIKRSHTAYDYVFLDPPFKLQQKVTILRKLLYGNLLHNGSVCVIHTPKKDYLPLSIDDRLIIFDIRIYGGSVLYFYQFAPRE